MMIPFFITLSMVVMVVTALPLERSRRQVPEQTIGSIDGDIFAVARCRVSCLSSQLNNASSTKFQSLADLMESEDPTASMCWETCQLLIENWWTWHYMCDQYRLCLPGCQKACQFVIALRDSSMLISDAKFADGDTKKKQCGDTSNVVGFSNIKWTCDAQDTFRGCQVSWGYPISFEKTNGVDDSCSISPPQHSPLVYVIFYNEDGDQPPPAAANGISNNADGVFFYKQQTFRAAAMTFESSITLTNVDGSNGHTHDGPQIATDSQSYQRPGDIGQPSSKRRGFFFQIVAVSSFGVVANSQTLSIRSGTYGLSPPFFPPPRLTPTVVLKNADLGLLAQLSWRYPLPFANNNTQSGINEIQLIWRRHSCNVEPTFPSCELIPRTWSIQLDPSSSSEFFLPNLTYNSAYELYVAMAAANSSRVLITTPGCFSPDRTFRRCLPTTVTKEQPSYENKNVSLIISLVATSVVVVVTAVFVGLFLYFRLYRQTKSQTIATEMANLSDPALPPLLRPGITPGVNSDDYADYSIATNYHPRSTGRDSAYDSYVGSVHQLSMMGMFRDQWEISESQLTIQKVVTTSDAVDVFRGVLGREKVLIKRLKSTTTDWRDHFLNELAILKMLERHANVLNVVACITANPSSLPVVVLEYFANSMPLADYWTTIQRHFLHARDKKALRRHHRINKPDIIEDADDEDDENEPDMDSLTMSLQPQTQLDFMRQMAAGLAHIHSHQFTHGCLEPYTSVLISVEARIVKITGMGSSSNLAKLVNTAHPEYYIERYLSPECGLANPIRTKQGDVWSFAIICWQMTSFGASPYLEIPPEKLTQCVSSGFKLEQPAAASNKLYELLLRCWDSLPHRRPNFQDVLVDLHTLLNSNSRHVDHNKILSSAMPVQMITPMLPEPVDPPRPSVADNDDDSVFGGSTLALDKLPEVLAPVPATVPAPVQKCVKILTPSYVDNETSMASDHV